MNDPRAATPAMREHLQRIAPLGGLKRSMHYDGREMTAAARAAFRSTLASKVDPDGKLARDDPDELARRVEAARREHYKRMAYRSAQVRRAKGRRLSPSDSRSVAANRSPDVDSTHDAPPSEASEVR